MSWRLISAVSVAFVVASCGGNPFNNAPVDPPPPTPPGGSVSELPGTPAPSAATAITRYEAEDGSGNGYAENITYDAATNTFSVDNLGFDGDNAYSQSNLAATDMGVRLGQYRVYEAAPIVQDPLTGRPIQQFEHRLLAGVSRSGNTGFALVRTGAYVGYGFGGFVLKRDVGVTLPTVGQAAYYGNYAGIRDFEGRGGLEYTSGDMTMAIDFEDFNDGNAVQGQIRNRRVYDLNGTDITQTILDAWIADPDVAQTVMPTLVFTVGPGVIDANGELQGGLSSAIVNSEGALEEYEAGNYYAIVAGDDAEEVVGIIVVESDDPRSEGVTARETGGFILYRDP